MADQLTLQELEEELERLRKMRTSITQEAPPEQDDRTTRVMQMGPGMQGPVGQAFLRGMGAEGAGQPAGGGLDLSVEGLMRLAAGQSEFPGYQSREDNVHVVVPGSPEWERAHGRGGPEEPDQGQQQMRQLAGQMAQAGFADQLRQQGERRGDIREMVQAANQQIGQIQALEPRMTPQGQRKWAEISQKVRGLRKLQANPRVSPQQIHEKQQEVLNDIEQSGLQHHIEPDPTPQELLEQTTVKHPETGELLQMTVRNGVPKFEPVGSSRRGSDAGAATGQFDPVGYLDAYERVAKMMLEKRQANLQDEDFIQPVTNDEVEEQLYQMGYPMPERFMEQKNRELQQLEIEEKRAELEQLQRQQAQQRQQQSVRQQGAFHQQHPGVTHAGAALTPEQIEAARGGGMPAPPQQRPGPGAQQPTGPPPAPPAPEPPSEPTPHPAWHQADPTRHTGPLGFTPGRQRTPVLDTEAWEGQLRDAGVRHNEVKKVPTPKEQANPVHNPALRAIQNAGHEEFEWTLHQGHYLPVLRVSNREEARRKREEFPPDAQLILVDPSGYASWRPVSGLGAALRNR